MASTMEGFVFRWTDDQGRTLKHRQHVYVLMEAHYMFLIDASKAILPSEQIPSVSNKSFNWLTSASTLLRIDRHWRRKAFASTPAFEDQKSLSKEELEKDVQRRMKQIALAYGVIDLSVMKDVRFGTDSDLDAQGNKCFQIDVEKRLLQFEAPSAQAMFSWVMKIRRMHQHSKRMQRQTFMMTNYLSETDQKKSILYSGMLYIKRHHYGTFKQWLCILTRDKQLLLFRRHQRRRWTQEAIYLGAYSKQQRLLLADAYTFHAAEEEHTNDIECPPRVFHDLSTGRETNDSCVFVIWQGAKRRYVVQWREYLNLLKLGHHLGRRGHIWICLARTREERNAWIWAIHCSQDIR
ncbi:uncharacterized protein BYT42DRAFT_151582 [Radiomyces spectabilis]|uniref:uncharacterized protein n=1 Tax=Radiomyces spectabilis TaxID=64574 RepID=UPI002220368B|nr:uncharacterized protein BYT42DRAFT_151582 [Radiomyces spectabilis]KAI8366040.1 hypothetical protein BYT42DRAFT_151582 [Radiomyces spectabilis]